MPIFMQAKQLIQFSTVADAGSISKAAERLNVAQPALSLAISNLESDLGATLFVRHRRGVELTEAGEILLGHAQSILSQMEAARDSIREADTNPAGAVSIALPASAANALSRPICETTLTRFPRIRLNLEEGLTGNLMQWLRSGRIDLMIDFDTDDTGEFSYEALVKEDLFLFGHGLSADKTISFSALTDYKLILPDREHAMGKTLAGYELETGTELTRLPTTLAVYPMLSLVTSGIGHSISPWSLIHDRIDGEIMRAQRIVDPPISRTSYLVSSRSRSLSKAAQTVRGIILKSVRNAWEKGQWRGELLLPDNAP